MDVQQKIRLGFAGSLLFLIIAGYAGSRIVQQLTETSFWVAHTHAVETLIASVIATLDDAETGQRGYLLTGDPSYLEPYDNSKSKIEGVLLRLKALTLDNPRQQEHIAKITVLAAQKMTELKETINLDLAGYQAEAREIILTHRGKQLMDEIRLLALVMEVEESQLLVRRKQQSDSAIRYATLVSVLGAILAFSIVGVVGIFVERDATRYISERDQAEQGLERTVTRLEQTLAKISTLEGIIPICSYCKGIRNDAGAWEKLEAYVSSHSNALFSHGICPECIAKVRAESRLL